RQPPRTVRRANRAQWRGAGKLSSSIHPSVPHQCRLQPRQGHGKSTGLTGQENVVMIRLKRAYEKPSSDDGMRILVERLWPRGLTKKRAAVDLWLKEIAPSPELRKWFSHDPKKWKQFETRYRKELQQNKDAVRSLK